MAHPLERLTPGNRQGAGACLSLDPEAADRLGVPASADLLGVRAGGHRPQRGVAGQLAGAVAHLPLPAVGNGRLRPGAGHQDRAPSAGAVALRPLAMAPALGDPARRARIARSAAAELGEALLGFGGAESRARSYHFLASARSGTTPCTADEPARPDRRSRPAGWRPGRSRRRPRAGRTRGRARCCLAAAAARPGPSASRRAPSPRAAVGARGTSGRARQRAWAGPGSVDCFWRVAGRHHGRWADHEARCSPRPAACRRR